MTTRVRFFVSVALVLVSSGLIAQPSPEQKKLEAMVGKWQTEIEFKGASPSKASGTEDCEWFANLHVVCHSDLTGPAGLYRSMRIVSYVPAMKQYAVYTIDSLGYAALTMGTNAGGTWTFTSGGQGWSMRLVMKMSGNSYTSLSEYAGADGKWVTTATSKSSRLK
ncbi:MAG TPA: DUF1579 family protein [Vicinamibacterales bacterium]